MVRCYAAVACRAVVALTLVLAPCCCTDLGVGAEAMKALSETALATMTNVEALRLRGTVQSTPCAGLEGAKPMCSWFAGNAAGQVGCEALARALPPMTKLRTLDLAGTCSYVVCCCCARGCCTAIRSHKDCRQSSRGCWCGSTSRCTAPSATADVVAPQW